MLALVLLSNWPGSGVASPDTRATNGHEGAVGAGYSKGDGGRTSVATLRDTPENGRAEDDAAAERLASFIEVIVRARRSGSPVPGAKIEIVVREDPGSEDRRIGPDYTDEKGYIRVPVPAGCQISVIARRTDTNDVQVSYQRPLSPGESRTVVVLLGPQRREAFYGRLIPKDGTWDVVTQTELRVLEYGRATKAVIADSTGLFHVDFEPDKEALVLIEVEGHAPIAVAPTRGHATPGTAMEVHLRPAGLLTGVVSAGGVPQAECEIAVRTDPIDLAYPEGSPCPGVHRWDWNRRVSSAADGSYRLPDLPPHVPLLLTYESRGEQPVVFDSVVLDEGEHRVLSLDIGACSRVFGVVKDQAGEPVAGVRAVLCTMEDRLPGRYQDGAVVYLQDLDFSVRRSSLTDVAGQFVFANVAPGEWLIGIQAQTGSGVSDLSAIGRVVRVEAGAAEKRVDLAAHRGLFVGGRVVSPEGDGLSGATIMLSGEEGMRLEGSSGENGEFVVGPLLAGQYAATVFPPVGGGAERDLQVLDGVAVHSGEDDLLLIMSYGSAINGLVYAPGGIERLECFLTARSLDGRGGAATAVATPSGGRFSIGGLKAGTYCLYAVADGRWMGVAAGLVLVDDHDLEGVRVVLEPGTQLVLSYSGGPSSLAVELVYLDHVFARNVLQCNVPWTLMVPSGSLRIRLQTVEGGHVVAEREIRIEPGERLGVRMEVDM